MTNVPDRGAVGEFAGRSLYFYIYHYLCVNLLASLLELAAWINVLRKALPYS